MTRSSPRTSPSTDAPVAAATSPAEPGRVIRRASLAGTALFAVTATVAAAVDGGPLRGVAAVVAVALFVAGSLAYLAGYARAVQRSRTHVIAMSGLIFLAGSAPPTVRRQLLGATAAQVVVALATASVRPFTSLAFGVLAPVFGLGLQCLWAARHVQFPARPPQRRPPAPPRREDTAVRPAPAGRRSSGPRRSRR
jgi:hypothetical protein